MIFAYSVQCVLQEVTSHCVFVRCATVKQGVTHFLQWHEISNWQFKLYLASSVTPTLVSIIIITKTNFLVYLLDIFPPKNKTVMISKSSIFLDRPKCNRVKQTNFVVLCLAFLLSSESLSFSLPKVNPRCVREGYFFLITSDIALLPLILFSNSIYTKECFNLSLVAVWYGGFTRQKSIGFTRQFWVSGSQAENRPFLGASVVLGWMLIS